MAAATHSGLNFASAGFISEVRNYHRLGAVEFALKNRHESFLYSSHFPEKIPSIRKLQYKLHPTCVLKHVEPPLSSDNYPTTKLSAIIDHILNAGDIRARIQAVLEYAVQLPRLPASERVSSNRVMGCTAQVWLTAKLDYEGRLQFGADSDSELTRGLCAILVSAMNGSRPQEVFAASPDLLGRLGIGIGGTMSRTNTWYNVLVTMQKKARICLAEQVGMPTFQPFPSVLITANDIVPQGDFAVAQAKYLFPDSTKVEKLAKLLETKKIGVVAHFYMDPEVQGVLAAAQKFWPHIHISDSLVMADRAVKMVAAGCKYIAVLGVDFMSENARAILDQAGYDEVPVYRMSQERIGCSLADAAESSSYFEFLEAGARSPPALHVIYINTSLSTKARAHALIPTITCTSSNVVQTVLQAFAEIPNLSVWYGPDSYMGANLAELFRQMSNMADEDIKAVHSLHNRQTLASLLGRFHYFHNGSCIVHDLFGKDVVERVRQGYSDAFQTAHFEVPGEMFSLAMEAKQRGMGTVGSTQNILDFIRGRVQEALDRGFDDRLQFVLGTEAGMITAIVGEVRSLLIGARGKGVAGNVEVEIVFPVSSDAISTPTTSPSHTFSLASLPVVPGVSSGEGCSLSGGCASCPYMKMNSLHALMRVCELVGSADYETLDGQQMLRSTSSDQPSFSVELGCEPILHMRDFQSSGRLPQKLLHHISTYKTG